MKFVPHIVQAVRAREAAHRSLYEIRRALCASRAHSGERGCRDF